MPEDFLYPDWRIDLRMKLISSSLHPLKQQ